MSYTQGFGTGFLEDFSASRRRAKTNSPQPGRRSLCLPKPISRARSRARTPEPPRMRPLSHGRFKANKGILSEWGGRRGDRDQARSITSIKIHVRELRFSQKLTTLDVNFQWVGNVAKLKYVSHTRFRLRPDEVEAVEVLDARGNVMMPLWKLTLHKDATEDGLTVILKRLSKSEHFTGMWHLQATSPESTWCDVDIYYDGGLGSNQIVNLFSNLNSFTKPITMRYDKKTGKTIARVRVPPQAKLRFFFQGQNGERTVEGEVKVNNVIKKYDIVENARWRNGQYRTMNEILVEAKKEDEGKEDRSAKMHLVKLERKARPVQKEIMEHKKVEEDEMPDLWGYQIVGVPSGQDLEDLFQKDWREVQLNDVIPDPEERRGIRQVMMTHWIALQQIFRAYCCRKKPVLHLDNNAFSMMIGKLRIYDKKNLTVSTVSQIFIRVNIEEDYGSDEDIVGTGGQEGMQIVEDEDNPDNLFIRSEFLEALVRVAIARWPKREPREAYRILLEKYLLRSEEEILREMRTPRELMALAEIKNVFSPYLKRLYKLVFFPVSMMDEEHKHKENRRDDVATASISFDEFQIWLKATMFVEKHNLKLRDAFKCYCYPTEPRFTGGIEDTEMRWPHFLEMLVRLAPCVCPAGGLVPSLANFLELLMGKEGIIASKNYKLGKLETLM
eukprot:CAMPEP_0167820530 /NCGR_PEP_ID=MMETSP0112_2-20121227/6156_1 /TAXON_ID=91324 /ORGANISM="Lotharella globosa, Strain CCCM811" /LENGTH=669 /DNA_ID=CAMNT_0007721125 /DNA_START=246 /DNA_END=2255 /DNA_ORIENTATION=+